MDMELEHRYTMLESVNRVNAALNLAIEYLRHGPPSREASLAITNAEQAAMWSTRRLRTREGVEDFSGTDSSD